MKKTVKNISISAKQLYDICTSLSFLSFDNSSEEAVALMFDEVVKEDIAYFSELLEKKSIQLQTHFSPCPLKIAPTKAKMLVNNLLGNAIKYSNPNTLIKITTTKNSPIIQDEGIGIKQEKLHHIFKHFIRANSYAGGFSVGLNIIQSIIKEYDFSINIQSKESVGTTITIIFGDI